MSAGALGYVNGFRLSDRLSCPASTELTTLAVNGLDCYYVCVVCDVRSVWVYPFVAVEYSAANNPPTTIITIMRS